MELLASSYIGFGIFAIIGLFIGGPLIDKVNTKKAIPYYLFPSLLGIFFIMFLFLWNFCVNSIFGAIFCANAIFGAKFCANALFGAKFLCKCKF